MRIEYRHIPVVRKNEYRLLAVSDRKFFMGLISSVVIAMGGTLRFISGCTVKLPAPEFYDTSVPFYWLIC